MITSALTAIAALLASATFLWIAGITILILMAILLEKELEGWATTVFSLGIALFIWNFRTDIWEFISSNPTATVGFAVSYIILGIVWSFLKWRSYVVSVFNKFKDIKTNFESKHGPVGENNGQKFSEAVSNSSLQSYGGNGYSMFDYSVKNQINKITPLASQKKSVITAWISYWPVSLAGAMLNNPFRRFFEWIYSLISGSFDRMTNHYKNDILG